MRPFSSALFLVLLAAAVVPAHAQSATAQMRERAITNCKANRGTDCSTAEGLKEWIDAERPRSTGQRSAIQLQKLEAERRAQQQADTKAAPR
jgi:hypothetical protein